VSVRQEILGYIPRNGWFAVNFRRRAKASMRSSWPFKSPSAGMPLGVALSVQVIKDPPRPREGNRESGRHAFWAECGGGASTPVELI